MAAYRIGLIVNPLAGMGGPVALKGTDGDRAARARALGAKPQAAGRATRALSSFRQKDVELLTCAHDMGEFAARAAGFEPILIYLPANTPTTGMDTTAAARALREHGIDLLLFAGGDGTARDILNAVGDTVPTLGIPAGVKMHSAVFAVSARTAGDVARHFLCAARRTALLHHAEVMDRDPEADAISPTLHGFLISPHVSFLVPQAKSTPAADDERALAAAATRIATDARDNRITLLGPGTTMQRVKRALGEAGTLLGVAIFRGGRCLVADATESEIFRHVSDHPARLVTSIVGGQGFLFGRGNPQLSPRVIRAVGRENLIVLASLAKLAMLPAGAVLVDTGDEDLDASLAGYLPVIVDSGRTVVVAIRHAADEARALFREAASD